MRLTEKQFNNLLRKINITEDAGDCWDWTAAKTEQGYGVFGVNGKLKYAHRLMYMLANSITWLSSKTVIRHKCDRPKCCNPSHLVAGTQKDNTDDRDNRNRTSKGEKHGASKLTAKAVAEIKKLRALGYTYKRLGDKFNVTPSNIWLIVNERTWKNA